MNQINPWFAARTHIQAESELPATMLKEMLKIAKSLEYNQSTTNMKDKSYRTSSNSWLHDDTWIAGILHNIMVSVNTGYFCYDLVHFDDQIQVTQYKKTQHYGWHIDQGPLTNDRPLPRKLSITLLLNDNFEGGDLEIYSPQDQTIYPVPMKAGTYCVFPSWVPHRVSPVTKGTRYSLVAWMNGPQFR